MSDEQVYFNLGQEYPFDDGVPEVDWAHRAARGVVKDLMDRRAIKVPFMQLEDSGDTEVMQEIVASLAEIIRIADRERT